MFITLEISRPFCISPGLYRCPGVTWRIYWLWFALSVHPMRFDEMIGSVREGVLEWVSEYKDETEGES